MGGVYKMKVIFKEDGMSLQEIIESFLLGSDSLDCFLPSEL